MAESWQLLLVDDHPMLRRGLCQLLEGDPRFLAPWEAGNGPEALALLARQQPDLVLLDLNMRPLSGLDTLRAIRRDFPELKVVMFTVSDHPRDVQAVLDAGANGYLIKDSEPEELVEGLAQVMGGAAVLTDRLEASLAEVEESWAAQLTPRERQIAELIAEGKSNKAIGEALFISEGTAKVHVKNLMRKTGCHSRVELAIKVREG
ncbi:response regulator [Ferrimonas balearica]|uniref:response regulator n=1 Tax=Ferrimonas balearica TaxID=44012 RepID=UPI001C99E10F|nr:response regulator [Ferrimonas balearica]MBY5922417.1 response regulator [Ferrimonas balearica]MBY5995401.1 response regulator [Ferrimonas balearica]